MTGAPPDFDLSGKVALVTGGSRGIGRETVRGFARAGADVMVVSRDVDSCRALAEEVTRETGRRAVPYLASDASSFTTGSLLTVDGGWIQPPPESEGSEKPPTAP